MLPRDHYDRTLLDNVHPADWKNPHTGARYNMVVVGAGTAGLVTAAIAAGIGAKVALIERHLMGGDCLNVGCVPSKALIRASRAWADLARAHEFGLRIPAGVGRDFGAVMERMRRIRARLSPIDSAARFQGLGVDVYLGHARFIGRDELIVEGPAGNRTVRFVKAAVCTGARPAVPAIAGLDSVSYLTNETVFMLTEPPARLAVIGAGPIGCELAQAFSRFGSQVHLIEAAHGILPHEDRDAAAIVQRVMEREGVTVLCCGNALKVEKAAQAARVSIESHGGHHEIMVDEILVSVGRQPNVEHLGLENAGVAYNQRGIRVDSRLRTTNSRIYAAGDVCSRYKFTHAADAMAQIVIQNALFPHPFGLAYARVDRLIMPWCTYTDPEIAHVEMYDAAADRDSMKLETYTYELAEVDRAILDGEEEGFARVHLRKGTDEIVGATIVAKHAGEMIGEFTALMNARAGAKVLAGTIHPYPTQADIAKKVVNQWRKAHFTDRQKHILQEWFAWTRR